MRFGEITTGSARECGLGRLTTCPSTAVDEEGGERAQEKRWCEGRARRGEPPLREQKNRRDAGATRRKEPARRRRYKGREPEGRWPASRGELGDDR
jgi:hypothetical protein